MIAELMNQFFRSGIEWEREMRDTELNYPLVGQMLKEY